MWSWQGVEALKKRLAFCLAVLSLLVIANGVQSLLLLPSTITGFEGENIPLDFDLPWPLRFSGDCGPAIEKGEGVADRHPQVGCYDCSYRLLGLPVKRIQVTVIPKLLLTPSGHSIGVKLAEAGVVVVGLDSIVTATGRAEPAKDSGFQVGDLLLAVNGAELKNLGHAAIVLEEQCKPGEKMECTILRDGKTMTLSITPAYDVELRRPRLGLLLKDTAAGVGTMTYYHQDTGRFGALGHMITDETSGVAVDMSSGQIVGAGIVSIRPGQQGKPGEKQGVFAEEDQPLGAVEANTELGIFGRLIRLPDTNQKPLPLGLKHEVKAGKAEILTVIEGETVERFSIEIEKIFLQNQPASKGLVIRITDPALLAATGGIIQGMSGSPIIQEGKIVGAVTHVFINEPQRGYGCFAEWMVVKSGLLSEIQSLAPPEESEVFLIIKRDTVV